MPPQNPYIAGPPIGGKTGFFGRKDILSAVEQTLRYPTNNSVILYGQRKTGKTSLLLQLERQLPSPPFFTIYFDLEGKGMLPVGQVLFEMAAAAAVKAGMTPPQQKTFKNNPDTFHEQFLPGLYQTLGHRLQPVFLLDEFHPLNIPEIDLPETTAIRNLDTYLLSLLSSQTHTDFIFAAGRRIKELSDVVQSSYKADLSLFIPVLAPAQSRALILSGRGPGL